MSEKSKDINAAMKKASARMKVITSIQNAQTHKAVHDKYLKIGWKAWQAAFAESHKDELDTFLYLKKQGVDLNVNLYSLQAEYSKLQATYAELAACHHQGGIAVDEKYSLLGQQSPHARAVRGWEKVWTEALYHGEDESAVEKMP